MIACTNVLLLHITDDMEEALVGYALVRRVPCVEVS